MWSKKIVRAGAILTMLLCTGSAVPAVAQAATTQTATTDMDDDGFDNWGLLGLLGLAGLLGRGRKDRTVTDTRRV